MRRVYVKDLSPGMLVSRDVMSKDGLVLLGKGGRLTFSQIEALDNWGISYIYIDGSMVGRKVRRVDRPAKTSIFMEEYLKIIETICHTFDHIRYFKEVPVVEMEELVDQHLSLLVDTVGAINILYEIRTHCDYTFRHSLNVAVLAGILGKWCNFKGVELKELILAGLLHDIGKLQVPLSILNKPGKLSIRQFDEIKKHPYAGYRLVSESARLPESVKLGILQHHERIDGSGYPFGLARKEIHDYAKIIAIADIYDAAISDRPYRSKLSMLEVIELIRVQMYGKLEVKMCLTFLDSMKDYLMGNKVLLSNGAKANVVLFDSREWYLTKPVVRFADGTTVDLQKEEISIVDFVAEG